jgi:hypothetical protein
LGVGSDVADAKKARHDRRRSRRRTGEIVERSYCLDKKLLAWLKEIVK